ncbi:MAG TPA: hypothetical protein VM841_10230 [Actinomycetota bacterium]|nr:hypothetical protein [Actinomycetota bacterium]
MAASLFVLGGLVPTAGHAASTPVECSGTVAANGTAECSVSFTISDFRYISNIGTYGNMIDLAATGTINMAWIDAKGQTVASWTCNGFGILGADVLTASGPSSSLVGGTPASPCVQNGTTADNFAWRDAQGNLLPQTFRVSVASTTARAATFHGAMNLSQGNCDATACYPDLIPIPPR